jgi:hypothetical protein
MAVDVENLRLTLWLGGAVLIYSYLSFLLGVGGGCG